MFIYKKGNNRVIGIVVFIFLLIALFVSLYYLYYALLDYSAEAIPLIKRNVAKANPNQSSFSGELQYYPNMRFPDKKISYKISDSCSEEKNSKMKQALTEIELRTGVDFVEASGEEQISIMCKEIKREKLQPYYIAGEGGPTRVINTSLFYVIEKGELQLFYRRSDCDDFNVELHELLHVLGFQHSDNKESIMYNVTFCNQVLTNDIADELKRLYSIQSLPDLYFEEVDAVKKGSYLTLKAEIKNQGLAFADNISLEIIAGEKTENFKVGDIDYGEGRIIHLKNLRIDRNAQTIKLRIIAKEELYKINNEIELVLEQ